MTSARARDTRVERPTRLTNLDLVLQSGETLHHVMALLHRKHVWVGTLIWLPSDRHHLGRYLRLAIASDHVPASHVTMLLRHVIGVVDVQLHDPAADRRSFVLPVQQGMPTRYVVWSRLIERT
jgi:hypothetical protein